MRNVIIGIDIGTSSVKLRACTEEGVMLSDAVRAYLTQHPLEGWAEQDPESWWQALVEGMRELTSHLAGKKVRVAGLGLTGHMHSFVLLDKRGRVVRPCVTWMDSRARDLIPKVSKTLKESGLQERILNNPAPGLTLLPLLWLMEHEKNKMEDLILNQGTLLFVKDYIRFRLTGEIAGDLTDASGSLLLDIPSRRWSEQVCRQFGIPLSILPRILNSDDVAGRLVPQAAETLNLPAGIPVAAGAGDQLAAALATGVLVPGRIQLMLGTGAQAGIPIQQYKRRYPDFLNVFCHIREGWLQGSVQNAGSALHWVCQALAADWDELWKASTTRFEDAPIFLPYLTGERSPILDPTALGSWFNLRLSTDRKRLLYSALEGVAWSIGSTVKGLIEEAGLSIDSVEIRCSGGGSSQPVYVRLISDFLGLPLTILDSQGASVNGAVALGAVAAGFVSNLQEAAQRFGLAILDRVEPDVEKGRILQERFAQFTVLRDSYLKNLMLMSRSTVKSEALTYQNFG